MKDIITALSRHKGALPLSWSRIQTMFNCPFKFDNVYRTKGIAPGPQEDPYAAPTGTMMHKIMQLCMMNCDHKHRCDMKTARYDDVFKMTYATCNQPDEVKRRMLAVKDYGRKILEQLVSLIPSGTNYIRTEHCLTLDRNWHFVEGKYSFNNLALIGYVDLLVIRNHDAMLVDYKTEPFTEERLKQTDEQLALYVFLEMLKYPTVRNFHTMVAFIGDATLSSGTTWTRDQLPGMQENFEQKCKQYLQAMTAPVVATPSKYCQWCEYAYACRERNKDGKRKE